jgi:hypothetical protein
MLLVLGTVFPEILQWNSLGHFLAEPHLTHDTEKQLLNSTLNDFDNTHPHKTITSSYLK